MEVSNEKEGLGTPTVQLVSMSTHRKEPKEQAPVRQRYALVGAASQEQEDQDEAQGWQLKLPVLCHRVAIQCCISILSVLPCGRCLATRARVRLYATHTNGTLSTRG